MYLTVLTVSYIGKMSKLTCTSVIINQQVLFSLFQQMFCYSFDVYKYWISFHITLFIYWQIFIVGVVYYIHHVFSDSKWHKEETYHGFLLWRLSRMEEQKVVCLSIYTNIGRGRYMQYSCYQLFVSVRGGERVLANACIAKQCIFAGLPVFVKNPECV